MSQEGGASTLHPSISPFEECVVARDNGNTIFKTTFCIKSMSVNIDLLQNVILKIVFPYFL